jgi:hypothetical protein
MTDIDLILQLLRDTDEHVLARDATASVTLDLERLLTLVVQILYPSHNPTYEMPTELLFAH